MTEGYTPYLLHWAKKTPNKSFLRTPDRHLTYAEALWAVSHETIPKEHFSSKNSMGSVLSWLQHQVWNPSEDSEIALTSGSTGQPKTAVIPDSAQLVTSKFINTEILGSDEPDEMILLPLNHSNARGRLKAALVRGATINLVPAPISFAQVKKFLDLDQQTAASITPMVYRQIKALAKHSTGEFLSSFSHLEFGSAGLHKFENDSIAMTTSGTTKIMMHYGLTEASRSFVRDIRESDHDDLGFPGAHVQFRIENDGELVISGPHTATGYLNENGGIDSILEVSTGDIVSAGNLDNLKLVGRKKNIVNIGGIKFFPELLEEELTQQYSLPFVCITSMPDDITGEKLAIFVPKGSANLEKHLATNKDVALRSAKIFEADSLPLLVSGKVDRLALEVLARRESSRTRL